MSNSIAVDDLRVGMYIHLDLGWMSHPFPLSSFRVASAEQVATIRSLGLERVRWEPARSSPADDGAGAGASARPAPTPAEEEEDDVRRAARRARAALAAQRAAVQLCERQHAEAARAWREALDAVPRQPEAARATTEALTAALLDKMLIDGEVCIRLLSGGGGERATAHAINVAVISLLLGRSFGLGRDEMTELGVGALLHDVGKLDVPHRLHHLEESFTSAELGAYREHVAHGVRHGRRMGLSPGALLVVAQHHEHADGSGFPMRLSNERLSTGARIVALVNRYDRLCNPALLARAMTPHEALSLLFAQSRSKFDIAVLNAFIRMMGVYPAGSVVQLSDDRYALVVRVNSSRPLRPRLLVHDPRVSPSDALLLDLEDASDIGIRRSLSPSKLPREALEYLAPGHRLSYFFEPAAGPHEEPFA